VGGELCIDYFGSVSSRHALVALHSAQWPKWVGRLVLYRAQLDGEGADALRNIFSGAEEVGFVSVSRVELMAVVKRVPRVKEVVCTWKHLEGSDGAVSLEGIVAACAAAQEARRPLVLCIESGAELVRVSEGGDVAPSLRFPEEAFERLEAPREQRLQLLPGPHVVKLQQTLRSLA
jgi:hypothetical protein